MAGHISTRCPNCSKKFKLKSEAAVGKRVPCPQCKEPFVVKPLKPKPTVAQSSPPDDDWMSDFNQAEPAGENSETYGVANTLPPVMQTDSPKPKPKRKRDTSFEEQADTSSYYAQDSGKNEVARAILIWIIGGSIAGVIGTLAWGGIIYATDRESSWVAWGIGALVGFGVGSSSRTQCLWIVGDDCRRDFAPIDFLRESLGVLADV